MHNGIVNCFPIVRKISLANDTLSHSNQFSLCWQKVNQKNIHNNDWFYYLAIFWRKNDWKTWICDLHVFIDWLLTHLKRIESIKKFNLKVPMENLKIVTMGAISFANSDCEKSNNHNWHHKNHFNQDSLTCLSS